ncbi:MAG: hypothetical protein A2418_02180 [Candidatus Brennerbacteria bacterium RIFOXYC1_FULL_41_11]|uniref:Uncharacterized protein n=1 Tax=Candidatus Brennerbacteria bacterium RIFOXYD1_FULL_41_16 TaxID=1797529 RepID=A0A1G1XLD5_9BACT|nr:MAG: hypothetical protein A2418_02180 [Candidatus Brennerbacteria bacterium RIFOXYC1_FULL_41_11]OGY40762.1 MAG: hypothetical protein A2570_01390 [Candidatus Brennerbacteria bacterium RIFOXYD1_FULL_41_16]
MKVFGLKSLISIGCPSPEQKGRKGNYHHPISFFAESKQRRIGLHPFVYRCITLINTGISTPVWLRAGNYPSRGYRAIDDVEKPLKTKQAPQGNVIKWILSLIKIGIRSKL